MPSVATLAFIANTDFGWFSHFLHCAVGVSARWTARSERPRRLRVGQPTEGAASRDYFRAGHDTRTSSSFLAGGPVLPHAGGPSCLPGQPDRFRITALLCSVPTLRRKARPTRVLW